LLCICIVCLLFQFSLRAQSVSSSSSIPLGEILNPDGTVNLGTGFQGSLDPNGYKMKIGKNGEPIFSPASQLSDTNWDDRFFLVGVNKYVLAMQGDASYLYVGGSFTKVGGLPAKGRWDGNNWSAMGDGIEGKVRAIARGNGNIYVGGTFTEAGGSPASNIAVWNGSSWSELGGGVNNSVSAIGISGTNVIVGGWFSQAGGTSVNNVAQWNGSSWSNMNGGMNNYVFAITMDGSDAYIGGRFTQAGGSPANCIAKWNGSTWSTLGAGVSGTLGNEYLYYDATVFAIRIFSNNIYAGGYFTTAGSTPANNIAMWNGSAWSALGTGVQGERYDMDFGDFEYAYVRAIAYAGNDILVGGWFTDAGGVSVERIAKWNGSTWSAMDSGFFGIIPEGTSHINSRVFAIWAWASTTYAGGDFDLTSGNIWLDHIAKWSGTQWQPMGLGVNHTNNYEERHWFDEPDDREVFVRAVAKVASAVYIGGMFDRVGGVKVNNIARWSGTSWSALDQGIDGTVYEIAYDGTGLVYVGGKFENLGDGTTVVNHIAAWNGSSWSALDGGVSGYGWSNKGGEDPQVRAICILGNDVYVGGFFTSPGNSIAKWDGAAWTDIGGVWPEIEDIHTWAFIPWVSDLAIQGTDVIVGGAFDTIGSVSGIHALGVAKWNGTAWSAIGNGVIRPYGSGQVYAIAVDGSTIYAGGRLYKLVSSVTIAYYTAEWDGTQWTQLSSDVNGTVYDLAVHNGDLYACGTFTTAGAVSASRIARWDGTNWSTLGSGITDQVYVPSIWTDPTAYAMSFSGDDLYVGGQFYRAGGKPTYNFSKYYVDPSTAIPVEHAGGEIPDQFLLSQNYPNPFNPETTIRYQLAEPSVVSIKIFNALGQEIVSLVDEKKPAGYFTTAWNGCDKQGRPAASGIYLYQILTEQFTQNRKMLLLR